MLELLFLETLSLISFLVAVFAMLFNPENSLLIWSTLVITFVLTIPIHLVFVKNKKYAVLYLGLFLPMLYFGFSLFSLMVPITVILYMTLVREEIVLNFKVLIGNTYGLLVFLYVLGAYFEPMFPESIQPRLELYWHIVLLFVLTSILFLRTTRYHNAKLEGNYIRKRNIRFAILSSIIYVFTVVDRIRDAFFNNLKALMDTVLSWIIKPFIWFFTTDKEIAIDLTGLDEGTSLTDHGSQSLTEFGEQATSRSNIIDILTMIIKIAEYAIIVGVVVFVVYKIYRSMVKRSLHDEEDTGVVSERSFIKSEGKKKEKRKWFFNRTPKEEIRYWYGRHMDQLDLEEHPSTTSQKVYEEGISKQFGSSAYIRDIYRETRYNESFTDDHAKTLLQEFRQKIKKD